MPLSRIEPNRYCYHLPPSAQTVMKKLLWAPYFLQTCQPTVDLKAQIRKNNRKRHRHTPRLFSISPPQKIIKLIRVSIHTSARGSSTTQAPIPLFYSLGLSVSLSLSLPSAAGKNRAVRLSYRYYYYYPSLLP